MPVLWYKTLEVFCRLYSKSLSQEQQKGISQLLKKKFRHEYFTGEILKWVQLPDKQAN